VRAVLAQHPRQTYGGPVADWLSIEVLDGAFPASQWRYAHGEALIEAALTNGASHWEWHEHRWGVLLELAFEREGSRDSFRDLPGVQAALDAVPDPVAGLLIYRGRGGGSGVPSPGRPRLTPPAGAAALPEPGPEPMIELDSDSDPDLMAPRH